MLYALFYAIIQRVLRLSGISSDTEAEVLVLRHGRRPFRQWLVRPATSRWKIVLFVCAVAPTSEEVEALDGEAAEAALPLTVGR